MRHFIVLLLSLVVLSCEKEFDPETTFDGPQMVVEAYVQKGPNAFPPYAILTKSLEYGSTIGTDVLKDIFVHDAFIQLTNGIDTVQLTEFCASDLSFLPDFIKQAISESIGIPVEVLNGNGIDICVYADFPAVLGLSDLTITENTEYTLLIETPEYGSVKATSYLYPAVPLDSLNYIDHPNFPANDSLVEVLGYFNDPADELNYYRLFSQRNDEPMYATSTRGSGGTVSDDNIFNGQAFAFNIIRGQDPFSDFNFDSFGYFSRGDTVTVRTSSIDYKQYRFWQTLEYNSGAQGPYGTYTRIESNIEGGLGIFGCYAYEDYTIIIPE